MSFQPITARWYATEVPMTPPPTTTTRAWAGILAGDELAAVTGAVRLKNVILASSYRWRLWFSSATPAAADGKDAMTVHSTQMKAGVTVGTGVRTVSKDGKTLTFAQKGTHVTGVKYDDVSV
jgi:hypothetical protein